MNYTRKTIRLDHSSDTVQQHSGLTSNLGMLIVMLAGALVWVILGGVTMETTISIVIHIPAWVMLLIGIGTAIGAVFGAKYLRDEL